MSKPTIEKKDWQRESFRVIYCNYQGEWITKYVVANNFTQCFNYVSSPLFDLWVIKEISCKIGNGELEGKVIIRVPEEFKK
jgi:hypothetical protein